MDARGSIVAVEGGVLAHPPDRVRTQLQMGDRKGGEAVLVGIDRHNPPRGLVDEPITIVVESVAVHDGLFFDIVWVVGELTRRVAVGAHAALDTRLADAFARTTRPGEETLVDLAITVVVEAIACLEFSQDLKRTDCLPRAASSLAAVALADSERLGLPLEAFHRNLVFIDQSITVVVEAVAALGAWEDIAGALRRTIDAAAPSGSTDPDAEHLCAVTVTIHYCDALIDLTVAIIVESVVDLPDPIDRVDTVDLSLLARSPACPALAHTELDVRSVKASCRDEVLVELSVTVVVASVAIVAVGLRVSLA